MTRRSAALAALLLALGGGCATQPEEATHSEPATEREHEDAALEPPAEAVAPTDEASPRSLDELQRELAANNARLRELGVELPNVAQGVPAADPELGGTTSGKSKDADGGADKDTSSVTPAPGKKPTTSKPSKSDRGEAEKPPRRDNKAGGAMPKPKAEELDSVDDVRPDEAKAAPPTVANELDPQQRCQQVCDLAAISCGLGDQICELADRHPGDTDFSSACERANADCEAAKEACDACAE